MADRAPVIELEQERQRRRPAPAQLPADAMPLPVPEAMPAAHRVLLLAHAHPYLSPGVACEL